MADKRTLIFDMGNVLVPFDFRLGYAALAPFCPHPAESIPERLRATDLVIRLESGLITPQDFVVELSKVLDYNGGYDRFCEIWSSIFLTHDLVPERLIQSLKGRYRLLLLSNTNAIHIEMIQRNYPIIKHFDHLILSHEVQAMKPDPRIYAAALAEARAEPEECFFTDDILEYVEGARLAGIDAEQFLGEEKLVNDLRARGVTV